MKNQKTLQILLVVQIVACLLGMLITYQADHDGADDFSGLTAVLPFGIFVVLGWVNGVLFVLYLLRVLQKKASPDVLVFCLAAVALGLLALLQ